MAQCCAPVLRTASCPAKLAGPIAVRSTPAGLAGRVALSACLMAKEMTMNIGVFVFETADSMDPAVLAKKAEALG